MRSCFRLGLLGLAVLALGACGDDDRGGVDFGPGQRDSGPAMCTSACEAGTTCCGASCVNTATSNLHCGGCGIACTSAQNCMGGVCVTGGVDAGPGGACSPTCPSSQRCCGTTCVNREFSGVGDGTIDSSFENCGACGIACDPDRADRCGTLPSGGPPQCLCGGGLECASGRICGESGGMIICIDLSGDKNNCGAIGNVCPGEESCSGGTCVCGSSGASCGAGTTCCGSGCIDTTSDPMNCGGCGNVCPANAPSCNGGTCGCGTGPACAEPMAGALGMPGNPGESCCDGACVANTDTSCLCEPCTGDETCQVGGGGIIPGMGGGAVQVCCGDESVAILGCGGFGLGDGGLPFP